MTSDPPQAVPADSSAPKPAGPPIAKLPPTISGRQRRFLRGVGHHLSPIVQVGKAGVTDSLLDAVRVALRDHELIKLRVGNECPTDRKEVSAQISERAGAHVAQVLGNTVLLYRRHPKEPRIVLPK